MKFLFIQSELSYRGAERVIATLSESLVEKEHTVTVIFLKKNSKLTENFFDPRVMVVTPNTVINKIVQNNVLFTLISPFYATVQAAKYTSNANVLVSDSFPCLWSAILIGKLMSKKIFWMMHSFEKIPFPQSSPIQKAYSKAVLSINKLLVKHVHSIIANSPKVRINAQEIFPNTNCAELIPPVSPIKNPKPTHLNAVFKNRKVILCIGHIHPLKNQQLAIDSFIKYLKQYPQSSLIFIGDGNPTDLNHYSLTFPELVFTGKLSASQLEAYYEIADIVLQTAFYPEGLGLTPFEGLSRKKLPIVVEGSGAAKIIQEQAIGIVVKNNTQELSQALIGYMSHPNEFEYTIQKGWEYVSTKLSPEYYSTQFLNLVKKYE